MGLLQISSSPHVHDTDSVKKIMWTVVIALIPTMIFSFIYFGWDAVRVTCISIAACIAFEWLIQKFLIRGKCTISDGSAVITGMLLAFNVPSNLDWYIILTGALVAIGISKMAFGGLGKNIFNPALVGRVFLLISFPQQMTTWPQPHRVFTHAVDATTGATPLGYIQTKIAEGADVSDLMSQLPTYAQLLLGERGGSLGEVAAAAIILGGIILLCRKVITWHIPVAFIGTAFVFATILHMCNPALYIPGSYHLLTGGLLLGAIFMATDMVTSPMTAKGKLIFGIGCGVLTICIRVWGSYPEGVSFAILLMNAFTPLINKWCPPARFGASTKL
ncbi:MAG: RnfABCDGE type electron transport complex subunit D [Bacteroidales bacterium]|nr:RnfABCDGE type electron transport complex subunit D [Bacteroidales bacterium]